MNVYEMLNIKLWKIGQWVANNMAVALR